MESLVFLHQRQASTRMRTATRNTARSAHREMPAAEVAKSLSPLLSLKGSTTLIDIDVVERPLVGEPSVSFWKTCTIEVDRELVWLVGFLTSSSTTRLYRGRAPRQSVWQFYVLPHMRQSWETMTSVSAGHIILTPTHPVGSGRPLWESNPGPPHQESRALPLSYRAPVDREWVRDGRKKREREGINGFARKSEEVEKC